MKIAFTAKLLADPPALPDGQRKIVLYDTKQPGLAAEVRASGVTMYARYKTPTGKSRWLKLGRYGLDITLDQARRRLQEVRGRVASGGDPANERQQGRKALTVAEFAEHFLKHQKAHKKSWHEDEKLLRGRIVRALGGKLLSELTSADIIRLIDSIVLVEHKKPATANRHLAVLKTLLSRAVVYGEIARSPAAGIKLMKENNQRQRYLDRDELRRFVQALSDDEDRVGSSLIMLLLLSGARFGEASKARHDEITIDGDLGLWKLPNPKGGKVAFKHLNSAAVALINGVPREDGNPFLFIGSIPGTNRKCVRGVFARVCKRAGITDFRCHDIRHTYASIAINGGASLFVVQQLLNHSAPSMTQRYAHLSGETLASASEQTARLIGGA